MSFTWKIILPLAIVVVGGAAVGVYKNRSVTPSTKTSETNQNAVTEKKQSYDLNSKPITDAEIDLLIKEASIEPPADADEEKDSALVTSDKESLNNFNAYVPTDF